MSEIEYIIAEPEEVVDVFAEKRKAALEYLGKKWVLHPEYTPIAKHSLIDYATKFQ